MNPLSSDPWSSAQARFQQADFEGALDACEWALARNPDLAGAHWMASRIHQIHLRFRLAVFHARRAVRALTPAASAEERLLVARRLVSTGEYRAASMLMATLNHESVEGEKALVEVCSILSALDDTAATLKWIDVAEERGVRNATLSYLRGNHLKFLGDFERAEASYEQAISMRPDDEYAHWALAGLGAPDAGRRITRMRDVLRGRRTGSLEAERKEAVLRFALFKELDGLDERAEAWQELSAALALKRRTIDHDRRREQTIFDHLNQAYDHMELAGTMLAEASPVPIFILGMPRTGTTLVERMLGNHPNVRACGELSEMRMAYKWVSNHYCAGIVDDVAAVRMSQVDCGMLGRIYMEATRWRAEDRGWYTDKHPGNTLLAGAILSALPNAKIVHVKRNAMDSCFSNLKELFADGYYEYSYDIRDIASHYRNYSAMMTRIADRSGGRIFNVAYEELVADPVLGAKRVLEHCGLPYVDGIYDVTRNGSTVSTASSVQVRVPVHTRNVQAWRRYGNELDELQSLLA